MVNVEWRRATAWSYCRHLHHLYSPKSFDRRRLDLFFVVAFEVIKVAQLTWLANSFPTRESLMSVKSQAVVHVIAETHEKKNRANRSTRASLSWVTVHADNIFRVLLNWNLSQTKLTLNPVQGFLGYSVNKVEGWSMVIGPMVRCYTALKVKLFIVSFSLWCVYNPVVTAMFLVQKLRNLIK